MALSAIVEELDRSAKACAIIEAATRVFLASGYGNASMEIIAQEAGVAKQTLYSHFGSKAQLFEAIIHDKCTQLLGEADGAPDDVPAGDAAALLRQSGRRFLKVVLHPENIAHYRAIVGESVRFPELADVFYRAGPRRAVSALGVTLSNLDAQGHLAVEDPEASANLFYAMLRGDLHMRCVLGLTIDPSDDEIETWVSRVVDAFLAVHR